MSALLAAEALKLRTTRTVWALLGATLGVTALAVAGAVLSADDTTLDLESDRGVRTVLHVSASGAIFVLVLGIIVSAGEYRQRTAVDTFLTTPQRWRVVLAKLVTGLAVGAGFGGASALLAMAVANHTYRMEGLTLPLDSGDVWSTLAGSVLYAALFGAIGAATGSLVRSQVGAIVGCLGWLFVVENLVLELAPRAGRWLPAAAGRALVRDPAGELLSQSTAAVVLAGYAAVVAVAAVAWESRRDA